MHSTFYEMSLHGSPSLDSKWPLPINVHNKPELSWACSQTKSWTGLSKHSFTHEFTLHAFTIHAFPMHAFTIMYMHFLCMYSLYMHFLCMHLQYMYFLCMYSLYMLTVDMSLHAFTELNMLWPILEHAWPPAQPCLYSLGLTWTRRPTYKTCQNRPSWTRSDMIPNNIKFLKQ